MVRTQDAYVVVLTVSVGQHLQPETALMVVTGTEKQFRQQLAHEIAAGLGPDRAQALTMLYALTRCDTVSSFASHWKKTVWAV